MLQHIALNILRGPNIFLEEDRFLFLETARSHLEPSPGVAIIKLANIFWENQKTHVTIES